MAYEQFASQLAGILGRANVLLSEEDRKVYSYDGTSTWVHKPDLVVFPTSTEHVEAVLKLANENRIPVTPGEEAPTSVAARCRFVAGSPS